MRDARSVSLEALWAAGVWQIVGLLPKTLRALQAHSETVLSPVRAATGACLGSPNVTRTRHIHERVSYGRIDTWSHHTKRKTNPVSAPCPGGDGACNGDRVPAIEFPDDGQRGVRSSL